MAYQPLNTSALSEGEQGLPHSIWGDILQAYDDQTERNYWMLEFVDGVRGDKVWELVKRLSIFSSDSLVSVHATCPEYNSVITEERCDSLFSFIRRGKKAPQTFVRRFLRKFLNLFQQFEKERFVHGNVNPGMFFFDRPVPDDLDKLDEIPLKLFLSLGASWEGEVRQPFLAPKYCAPEMCNPEFGNVSWRSDVYSLGMVALELLIGSKINKLFDPNDLKVGEPEWLRIQSNLASDELPNLSDKQLKLNIPNGLAEVLNKMLKRNPKDRPRNAELIKILDDSEERDSEYQSECDADDDSTGLGGLSKVLITYTGTDIGERDVDDVDPDDKPDSLEPQKSWSQAVGEAVAKYALKPYVLFPGSALILVGLMSFIVGRLGAWDRWIELPIVPTSAQSSNAEAAYALECARVYLLKEGEADTNYVKEIPKEMFNGSPLWLLSTSRRRLRIVADGYEPQVVYVEIGKNGLVLQDAHARPTSEFKLQRNEVGFSIDGWGRLKEEERASCKVYRNVLEIGARPGEGVVLSKLDEQKPWNEDSYRAGIYRRGYKPEFPRTIGVGSSVRLRVPIVEMSRPLSKEEEDLAEEIYALLCAVPYEWDNWKVKYDGIVDDWRAEYDGIVDFYMNALEGADELKEARDKFLNFFTQKTTRVLERQPLFLETSRYGLWRKTSEAIKNVCAIENSFKNVDRREELDVLKALAMCQDAFETTCMNNEASRFMQGEPGENGQLVADPAKAAYDELKKIVETENPQFSSEIRILAARVFARYAVVQRILDENRLLPPQEIIRSEQLIDRARRDAKKQLDFVVNDESQDSLTRTTANYLSLCVDFSRFNGARYNDADEKDFAAKSRDYEKLAGSSTWDESRDETDDPSQSEFVKFYDFETASDLFSKRDDFFSRRRAVYARLQRFGAQWKQWETEGPREGRRNEFTGDVKTQGDDVMELYSRFLKFYFCSQTTSSGSADAHSQLTKSTEEFAVALNDAYRKTVPKSSIFNDEAADSVDGESSGRTTLSIGDPDFPYQYFCIVDGEFLFTADDLVCGFREAIMKLMSQGGQELKDVQTGLYNGFGGSSENSQAGSGEESVDARHFISSDSPFRLYSPVVTPLTRSPNISIY